MTGMAALIQKLFGDAFSARVPPGEWRQANGGGWIVHWTGDALGLMAGARARGITLEKFSKINVERGSSNVWRVRVWPK